MSAIIAPSAAPESRAPIYLAPEIGDGQITRTVIGPLFARPGLGWWIGFLVSLAVTIVMLVSIGWLFIDGVGIWGINTTEVWGFAIANYVWWIGIGNAGTLISSLLLLTRQRWRSSINRFAETMTLFAASIAGLFPILHLGRPYLFYWLVPYSNVMSLWPQWRSPLVWDLFAIGSYIIFSALFWYTGMLPDLATMRDRSRSRIARRIYGAFALGWTGSARQWREYETFYWAMAAIAVPLVVSVHSVVGLDFAAGLMPGWQETIFPPYFVVGAMFSGFAMVITLAIPIRAGMKLESLITLAHLDAMAKILLMGSIVMGLSYASEWFVAWYAGATADRTLLSFEFTGAYAPYYWALLLFNVGLPQLFWFPALRRSLVVLFGVAMLVNVGMWLERILIIINTLSRDFLPSQWGFYVPTIWDWLLLAGTLGFFCFMFFCFVRLLPIASMHELRQLAFEERKG